MLSVIGKIAKAIGVAVSVVIIIAILFLTIGIVLNVTGIYPDKQEQHCRLE